MRRALCFWLILLLWLGPLAAYLPASAESRLPACCRRHGVHRCTMSATRDRRASGALPALGAPSHCPQFPGLTATFPAPVKALAVSLPALPALFVLPLSSNALAAAPLLSKIDSRSNRGPPISDIG